MYNPYNLRLPSTCSRYRKTMLYSASTNSSLSELDSGSRWLVGRLGITNATEDWMRESNSRLDSECKYVIERHKALCQGEECSWLEGALACPCGLMYKETPSSSYSSCSDSPTSICEDSDQLAAYFMYRI